MRLTQALLIIIDESDDSDVDVSLQDDHAILLQWLNGIAKKCMHELLVTNNSNTSQVQLLCEHIEYKWNLGHVYISIFGT